MSEGESEGGRELQEREDGGSGRMGGEGGWGIWRIVGERGWRERYDQE